MEAVAPSSTKEPRRAPFLLILGGMYALVALVFIFFPNELIYLLNVGPKVFKVTEAIPELQEFFWSLLAGAMMAMLSVLCFLSAETPQVRGYFLVHLLANTICILGFITLFMNHQRYFAYLVGAVMDLAITGGLLWNEWTGRRSRPNRPPGASA